MDDQSNPVAVICPGFVDRKTFNKAYRNEWDGDLYDKETWDRERRYEFYIPHKTKAWKRVDAGTKGARKFTVMPWD